MNSDKLIKVFREKINTLLAGKQDLRDEFDLLYERSLDDRPMALARARRLVEILVVDAYIDVSKPAEPYGDEIKSKKFYQIADELRKYPKIAKQFISLCKKIDTDGNKALHYAPDRPNYPRQAVVTDGLLCATWRDLAEVIEIDVTGGYSIYVSTLLKPFDAMYQQLREVWAPNLWRKNEGAFPLFEALDLLFRSVIRRMEPEWLDVLAKYSNDNTLPMDISNTEEVTLRNLRNLGLIEHDSESLFRPVRSTKVWPTQRGEFILALYALRNIDAKVEQLAREVINDLTELEQDHPAVSLLHKIQKIGRISGAEQELARRLRNWNLIAHSTDLLAATEEVMLTDLGHYVLDGIDDAETEV